MAFPRALPLGAEGRLPHRAGVAAANGSRARHALPAPVLSAGHPEKRKLTPHRPAGGVHDLHARDEPKGRRASTGPRSRLIRPPEGPKQEKPHFGRFTAIRTPAHGARRPRKATGRAVSG